MERMIIGGVIGSRRPRLTITLEAAQLQAASKAVSKLKWPFQCRWNGQARPAAPLRSSQRAPKIEVLLVRRPHGWEPNVLWQNRGTLRPGHE